MDALPALSAIATRSIRRQFAPSPVAPPRLRPSRPQAWRIGLAALLDGAARALVPAGRRPAY